MPRDSFQPQPSPAPADVKHLRITMEITEQGDGTFAYAGNYAFTPVDANGDEIPGEARSGALISHLTDAQKQAIASFLQGLLTKAKGVAA